MQHEEPGLSPELGERLCDTTPVTLSVYTAMGQHSLQQCALGLFCSGVAPAGVLLAIHDLAQGWRESGETVIGGFHSPVEREALTILLRSPGQAVVCLARGIGKMRMKPEWREAFEEGRLTLISPFPDSVRRPTKQTAYERNRVAAALAEKVLVAHALPGSSTWRLAEEVIGWGKTVYTLEHAANSELLALGARPIGR